ncbi:MAG TPA: cation:proton antiporter [Candidatus Polarisedimenticolia bacterium]|nr:cation:proton antiporter [Candidatus Polarisedimenticolia bacterium]
MDLGTLHLFVSMVGLTGAVIMVSALLSGVIERTGVPHVAVFLGLGAIIGPMGLGLIDAGLQSPLLHIVATLSLALVLFTDALSINLGELRRHKVLAALVLGPGTLASAGFIALAGHFILDIPPAQAAMLGAALASTDPVLLRGLLKDRRLGGSVRQALRLESGMNDAALLPVVLVALSVAAGSGEGPAESGARVVLDNFVLGPAAGVLVGLLGVAALELVRKRMGIRRDYESLYSLGIAFAAFAAAETVHGSGFLAAFTAGLTIAILDVELCDCFLEYGETTAEMALLFTFVLFGTSLIWSGLGVITPLTLLFAALVFLLRPLAFLPALWPARALSWRERLLIAWFGPRGLSSLLLMLLPVIAGVPGAGELVQVCCLVVLISIVLHGLSPRVLLGRRARPDRPETAPAGPGGAEGEDAGSTEPGAGAVIDTATVASLRRQGRPLVVADARSHRSFQESDLAPEGAVRLDPDRPVSDAARLRLSREAVIAVLCA